MCHMNAKAASHASHSLLLECKPTPKGSGLRLAYPSIGILYRSARSPQESGRNSNAPHIEIRTLSSSAHTRTEGGAERSSHM